MAARSDGDVAVQREHGVQVALLTPMELHARFPWMNVDDLAGGSLGLADEGWFDAYALLQAFRRKARSLGVEEVTGEVLAVMAGMETSLAAAAHAMQASNPRAAALQKQKGRKARRRSGPVVLSAA